MGLEGGGRIYERWRSSGLRPFCFVIETSLPCGRFRSSKPNKFRSIADRQWRVLGIGSHGDRPQQYVQCTATSWKFPRRRTPFLPSTLAFAFFLAFFPSFLPSSLPPSLVAALSISWYPFVRYSAFLTSISPSLPFSIFSLFFPSASKPIDDFFQRVSTVDRRTFSASPFREFNYHANGLKRHFSVRFNRNVLASKTFLRA